MTAGLKHNILAMKATKQTPHFVQVLVTFEEALARIETLETLLREAANEIDELGFPSVANRFLRALEPRW